MTTLNQEYEVQVPIESEFWHKVEAKGPNEAACLWIETRKHGRSYDNGDEVPLRVRSVANGRCYSVIVQCAVVKTYKVVARLSTKERPEELPWHKLDLISGRRCEVCKMETRAAYGGEVCKLGHGGCGEDGEPYSKLYNERVARYVIAVENLEKMTDKAPVGGRSLAYFSEPSAKDMALDEFDDAWNALSEDDVASMSDSHLNRHISIAGRSPDAS